MVQAEERQSKLAKISKMPHSYVIIFFIIVLVAILGNIIPAGEFNRVLDQTTGKEIVVSGSFHYVDKVGVSFLGMFMAIHQGFVDAADIIFFIVFAYGFVYMLVKNGTFDAAIGALAKNLGNKIELMIPVGMILCGILGSTMGIYEETYGLLPVFISMAMALGYDAIVGGSIIYIGVAVGFAAATTNPFTIGVAQPIAGVELYSGMSFRILCFVVFMAASIAYVWRYSRKVKADPTKSIMYGVDYENKHQSSSEEILNRKFEPVHKISCLIFVGTVVAMLVGTLNYGWYINELAALFCIVMILTGIVSGFGANKTAEYFVEAAKDVMFGAMIVGLSRAIPVVMEDAKIIDTIVNWLANMLSGFTGYLSGFGMLFVQNIINFFIPSGAGQATVTMPIMAPVAELVGLSKQVAVLAYQFGDGFSNIFWPTSVFMMCGIMGIPINKWYKFITPLFGVLVILQFILLAAAIAIGV